MTPIDQQLREKWKREAQEKYPNSPVKIEGNGCLDATITGLHEVLQDSYLAACEARHREYQERVATLEGLLREIEEEDEVTHTVFFGENLKRLRAALSPPPAKQQEP